jgi:hypothetical protein
MPRYNHGESGECCNVQCEAMDEIFRSNKTPWNWLEAIDTVLLPRIEATNEQRRKVGCVVYDRDGQLPKAWK